MSREPAHSPTKTLLFSSCPEYTETMTRRGLFGLVAGLGPVAQPIQSASGPPLTDFLFGPFHVWADVDCQICGAETDGRTDLSFITDRSTGISRLACNKCMSHFRKFPVRLLTGDVAR